MKLQVPFYRQTNSQNCGPIVLKMVLAYFDNDQGLEILEKKTGMKKGKGLSTIQLAIATARLGYKTDFYSTRLEFNEENLELDYYQNHPDGELISQSKELVEEAGRLRVNLREESLSLGEILRKVTKDSIPIVLVDWGIFLGKDNYQGHFVPVVGYDKENVYIHNSGLESLEGFTKIRKEIFDKMRMARGTDEDIMVVHRK